MERSKLPNSTASLVLGILSIPSCICYGVVGLILGIIAIVLGKNAQKIYREDPEYYTGPENAKAGVVTGIIGVVLNLIYLGFIIWLFSTYSLEELQEILQDLQNRS
ncbi:MAG: DUF4190 domain-containing protein [Flavobacteriaceae bacterium]